MRSQQKDKKNNEVPSNMFPDIQFHLDVWHNMEIGHIFHYVAKFYLQNMFPKITFLYTYTKKNIQFQCQISCQEVKIMSRITLFFTI